MNGWYYPNTDGPKFMEIQIPSVIVRFVESVYLFLVSSDFDQTYFYHNHTVLYFIHHPMHADLLNNVYNGCVQSFLQPIR